MKPFIWLALFACVGSLSAGERMHVRVVGKQSSSSAYSYVVPGYSRTQANAQASCFGSTCNASGASTTTSTPGFVGSYQVSGATFTLQLPDGRLVVVNCGSKLNWGFGAPRRSCRIPIVDELEAEFSGEDAKLEWPVSIDGRKTQSESYRILGILGTKTEAVPSPAPSSTAASQPATSTLINWLQAKPAAKNAFITVNCGYGLSQAQLKQIRDAVDFFYNDPDNRGFSALEALHRVNAPTLPR